MQLKIGARIIKTALAVVICVLLGSLVNEKSGFFSSVAAIIAMQSTISDSYIVGRGRVLGTFFGALLGYLFSLIASGNFLLIGIGIISIIYICNNLKWEKSAVIACVVFLSIMLDADKDVLQYSVFRLLDTTAGIVIAFLINYFVAPNRPLLAVYKECSKVMEEFAQIIENILTNKSEVNIEKAYGDILKLRDMSRIKDYDLKLYHEDEHELRRMENIIEGLLTIYEHISFVEELRKADIVAGNMDLPPDIVLEFHRRQVLRNWEKVQKLWQERSIAL